MEGSPPERVLRAHVAVRPRLLPVSPRVREVCRQFGMVPRQQTTVLVDNLPVPLQPGQIILITGPSGAGKSATLRCLAGQLGRQAVWVSHQQPHNRSAMIDQVAPDGPLAEALSILTSCGLGEPRLWLRRYGELSDGEQFRVRLAIATSRALREPGSVLLVDEFCAILHRRLACAMAFNLRKMVSARRLCLIVATTHDDLQADLQPDIHLRMPNPGPVAAVAPAPSPISFFPRLTITPGRLNDYKFFEAMHYRHREGLGPVSKVFVLRDGPTPLAIVVYGYPPLSLHLRNCVTGSAYHRQGCALNTDFRILRRLVVHPDVRGCGLARWLVAQTLPQVGTRYVECLAAMGEVNPVFERAGMIRLGQAGRPEVQQRVREALARLRADPLDARFEHAVHHRSDVRAIVSAMVHRWLRATTGRPMERLNAMTSRQLAAAYLQMMDTQPVYYLWSADTQEMTRLREQAARLLAQSPARQIPAKEGV